MSPQRRWRLWPITPSGERSEKPLEFPASPDVTRRFRPSAHDDVGGARASTSLSVGHNIQLLTFVAHEVMSSYLCK